MTSKSKWSVIIVADAQDDFAKLDRGVQKIALKQLEKIKKDPLNMGRLLRSPLVGFKKLYFLRKTQRIVFTVKPSKKVAEIWAIGPRDKSSVYRLLEQRLDKLR